MATFTRTDGLVPVLAEWDLHGGNLANIDDHHSHQPVHGSALLPPVSSSPETIQARLAWAGVRTNGWTTGRKQL